MYYPAATETNGSILYLHPFRYNTESLLGTFCIPYDESYADKETYEKFKKAFFESSYGAASA